MKSRRLAVCTWTRSIGASGSFSNVPLVSTFSTSADACWTLRSMSMVKRGVSGIVRRK
jgi:hypothetical protein